MNLNLCIDIDGTLTDPYYWLKRANIFFDSDIKPWEVTSYNIAEVLNVRKTEYDMFYELYGEQIHEQAKIREDAKEVLWSLNQDNNIYYVTARDRSMQYVTEKWISKHKLPKGELFLLGTHHKSNKASSLDCDIFIEDSFENAIELAKSGIKVLLIDCSYNRLPLIPGIKRVASWVEIHDSIEEYKEEIERESIKIA